jgi:rare lipoprotein A
MRNSVLVCAIIIGFTGAALADEQGVASFYENPHFGGLIAAHRSLPFGTQVKVFNLDNGRSAVVKIVDRGPFIRGRIIDVSPFVAGVLGFMQAGIAHVRIQPISAPGTKSLPHPNTDIIGPLQRIAERERAPSPA